MRLQHDICWTFEFLLLFLRLLIVFSFSYCWCCRHRLLFYFMELLCYVVFVVVVVADAAAFFQYKCVCKFCLFLCAPFFSVQPLAICTYVTHYFSCESSIRAQSLIQFSWKCKGMHETLMMYMEKLDSRLNMYMYIYECASVCGSHFLSRVLAICVYAILVSFCICKTCNTKSIYTK